MKHGRTGFTTGSCAAAAAKAAARLLCGFPPRDEEDIRLPDGARVRIPITSARCDGSSAHASVTKDAGDDPDVTDGCVVRAEVECVPGTEIVFMAGEGVGTVTKPGLSVAPGEPAINPTPRKMIHDAVREFTHRGLRVTISIPEGKRLADKTFNPKLGIVGGLSILGTSGIVRPFSAAALRDALRCSLAVAVSSGVSHPVFVPGKIGERAARACFDLTPEQVVEVSNEWGFMLDEAACLNLARLLVMGHPAKLAKLPEGWWDTHSSRSGSAMNLIQRHALQALGSSLPEHTTVEGVFQDLDGTDRGRLGCALAASIRRAVLERIRGRFDVSVALIDMKGNLLGSEGELDPWKKHEASPS